MKWLLLSWLALVIVTQVWLTWRVSRSSTTLAVFTFFLGPIGALYTFFRHRGDEETSVTVPFIANLVFSLLLAVTVWQVVVPLFEADARELRAAGGDSGTTTAVARPASAASVATAASAAAAASATAAADLDEIDAFSQALRDGGLAHTVARLPSSTPLPQGVTGAASFTVAPRGSAAAASGVSAVTAPGVGGELTVTLFKCESAPACRELASVHIQQSGAERRRVLQNGPLLLSTPPAAPDDADLTPAAVASTFRKLQF